MLTMDHVVICGGESGWQYDPNTTGSDRAKNTTPLIVADAQGRAQGVSIERGLRVKDVLGKMVVMQEVRPAAAEKEGFTERNRKKQSLALGLIGCQCMK